MGLTWHAITIGIYLTFLGIGFVMERLALRPGSSIAPLGTVIRRLRTSHAGRVGLAAGWMWIGLHFFAR